MASAEMAREPPAAPYPRTVGIRGQGAQVGRATENAWGIALDDATLPDQRDPASPTSRRSSRSPSRASCCPSLGVPAGEVAALGLGVIALFRTSDRAERAARVVHLGDGGGPAVAPRLGVPQRRPQPQATGPRRVVRVAGPRPGQRPHRHPVRRARADVGTAAVGRPERSPGRCGTGTSVAWTASSATPTPRRTTCSPWAWS